MEFLRRMFSKKIDVVLDEPLKQYIPNWKICENWEAFQKEPTCSTIGGPHRMDTSISSNLKHSTDGEDLHLFSPSGRYILENTYRRQTKCRSITIYLKDGSGMGPLLEIIDFSNKRAQLFANEKLIGSNPCEFHGLRFTTYFVTAYWISDVQLVIVYTHFKNNMRPVQCLYTINYETNTYKEEVFEYTKVPFIYTKRTPPNPLLINNKAYFTLLDNHFLYLIPWIPSHECKHIGKIVLNRKDPILMNGNYRLVVGQESIRSDSFHYNYGSRVYFYIQDRERNDGEYELEELYPEREFDTSVDAKSDRMVYIDFSKYKNIDLTREELSFPFGIAYFTRNEEIEDGIELISDDDYDSFDFFDYSKLQNESYRVIPLPENLRLSGFRVPRFLNYNGRYITYTSDSWPHGGYIFDLATMTWAKIPKEWRCSQRGAFL